MSAKRERDFHARNGGIGRHERQSLTSKWRHEYEQADAGER